MRNKLFFILLLSFSILILGFTIKRNPANKSLDLKALQESMKRLPSGTFWYSENQEESPFAHDPNIKQKAVKSFYMCDHEVSNGEYKLFIQDLTQTNKTLAQQMMPDTNVWLKTLSYGEPFKQYYYQHPAYTNYPVVGVTHEQAKEYCKWLSHKYQQQKKPKVKNAVFDLPTEDQWIYAANGKNSSSIFGWEGSEMMNEKGHWMGNFKYVPQENITQQELSILNDSAKIEKKKIILANSSSYDAFLTTEIFSNKPNSFGLYNMSGNVSEYVLEPGIVKGGSWNTTGYYLRIRVHQTYDSSQATASDRGFRIVMMGTD